MCVAEPGRESARLRAAVNPCFLRRPREGLNNAFREPLVATFEIRRPKKLFWLKRTMNSDVNFDLDIEGSPLAQAQPLT
jgi:hypothetical protein